MKKKIRILAFLISFAAAFGRVLEQKLRTR